MSAAPEIALLAAAASFPAGQLAGAPGGAPSGGAPSGGAPPGGAPPGGASPGGASPQGPLTVGTLSRRLRMLAAAPERWWGLVRFDPGRSFRIDVEDQPEYGAWLMIMPPGAAGRPCDCDVATVIAGEAAESDAALQPSRVRVHGQRHWLSGHGPGYSITLHARAQASRPLASPAAFSAAELVASR